VLHDRSFEELLVEPVQIVERVEQAYRRMPRRRLRPTRLSSTMMIDRLLLRGSTAQLTAECRGARAAFAPKNTSVVAGGFAPCVVSRREAVRRIAPWNASWWRRVNLSAPARID
jgi:hypothetical protein